MTTELEKMEAALGKWLLKNPLKLRMEALEWSQQHTAALMKVSREAVYNWMTGMQKPKPDNMERVAVVLDVPVDKAEKMWNDWLKERP